MPIKTDKTKLLKIHKSICIVIPYFILRELKWKKGDRVKITIQGNNKILVEKVE